MPERGWDTALTRRQLLAGGGAAVGGGGVVATGLYAPQWLPDPVTDVLLHVYPDPPEDLWRPEVSDAHADRAVEHLERAVTRGRELGDRVEADDLPDELEFHLRRDDPSGGLLADARTRSDPRERLFAATVGLERAGEYVGAARVALDETDPAALAERGEELRRGASAVLDSLGDYPVSDPLRDVAYLYFLERELEFARLNAHRSGIYAGGTAHAEDYSDRDVVRTWGSHLQAEQRLRNARYYRDRYEAGLQGDARAYRDVLEGALGRFTRALEEFPSRHEVQTSLRDADYSQESPYGAARWHLFWLCVDTDFRAAVEEGDPGHGLVVKRAVEGGRALLSRRAHDDALSELGLSPDDAGFDSGRAFAGKRRAVRTFRSVRAAHGSPAALVLADEAADLIRFGEIGVGIGTGWEPRLEAAAYYHAATGQLNQFDDVFGELFDGPN